jgi:hypothetical protein
MFDEWTKGSEKINSFLLVKSFIYRLCFVMFNRAISLPFDFKDPTKARNIGIR